MGGASSTASSDPITTSDAFVLLNNLKLSTTRTDSLNILKKLYMLYNNGQFAPSGTTIPTLLQYANDSPNPMLGGDVVTARNAILADTVLMTKLATYSLQCW